MRKPPCRVRSVFQCSLCTLLCASWLHGFVWLQKHKVTRQTLLHSHEWFIYSTISNTEQSFFIAETGFLSFFLHKRPSIPAPNPLDLNSNMRDDRTSLTVFMTGQPCTWGWHGGGEGHTGSDTWFLVCFRHQPDLTCYPVIVSWSESCLKPETSFPLNKVGVCKKTSFFRVWWGFSPQEGEDCRNVYLKHVEK